MNKSKDYYNGAIDACNAIAEVYENESRELFFPEYYADEIASHVRNFALTYLSKQQARAMFAIESVEP